jgi:hypothetical protein
MGVVEIDRGTHKRFGADLKRSVEILVDMNEAAIAALPGC